MIDSRKLQRIAKSRGIGNVYGLAKAFKECGYSCSESQAKRFWDGTTDAKHSSLNKLRVVLNCSLEEIEKPFRHKKPRPPKADKESGSN